MDQEELRAGIRIGTLEGEVLGEADSEEEEEVLSEQPGSSAIDRAAEQTDSGSRSRSG